MVPIKFPGVGVVAGERQGYIPLPMQWTRRFDAATEKEAPAMVTRWVLDDVDLETIRNSAFAMAAEIQSDGQAAHPEFLCVEITILGNVPPPMRVRICKAGAS